MSLESIVMYSDDIYWDFIRHYGTPRHSGRYPWGSGENPYQRTKDFVSDIKRMKSENMSEVDIAKSLNMNTAELRARYSAAMNYVKKEELFEIKKLKEKGYSDKAIGEKLGLAESTVRSRLKPDRQDRLDITTATTNVLRDAVDEKKYVDIGIGTENYLGVSRTRLKTAIETLKDEGYNVYEIYETQVGTGQKTTILTLAKPEVTYKEVYEHRADIGLIQAHSEDMGHTYQKIEKPRSISSDRIMVRYPDEGGGDKDGVIELRRGVPELSLKDARYAQVRVAVDGTHYLKGMAIYGDDKDFPPGVDIIFNTSKSREDHPTKLDTMKKMKSSDENPFGANVKMDGELIRAQRHYIDENGNRQLSCLNIVYEEGNWSDWKKTLSSQMLSKQKPALAKEQLKLAYDIKKEEYDTISSLTNPIIKRALLQSFAEDCDSAAVHLKAAGLPRQQSHVILPDPTMKPNEIYAPNYRDGERVILIRYPHAGPFESPELIVNNKSPHAKATIGRAPDAVMIHPSAAAKLSGADFDGDTVLVIPNNDGKLISKPSLKGLKDFDPHTQYKGYPGMPIIKDKTLQQKMGDVSNLITDMTIKGAPPEDICKAVKHSMVVIDAKKHELDYKRSYIENDIRDLKARYQGVNDKGQVKGASTLISQASSQYRVDDRKEGAYIDGYSAKQYVDPVTGKKLYTYTGETYDKVKKNEDGTYTVTKKGIKRQLISTKMAETDDARTLSSGTEIEEIYAEHANKLKALANRSRLDSIAIQNPKYSPSAKATYSAEVASLNAKLNKAKMNAPLERQAQLLANRIVDAALRDNPAMDKDELKKRKGQALNQARLRIGASKQNIDITPKEYEAIQAGAISANKLTEIIANSDMDKLKQLAMPRTRKGMTTSQLSRARAMIGRGYTQAEVADALGVSVNTLKNNDLI